MFRLSKRRLRRRHLLLQLIHLSGKRRLMQKQGVPFSDSLLRLRHLVLGHLLAPLHPLDLFICLSQIDIHLTKGLQNKASRKDRLLCPLCKGGGLCPRQGLGVTLDAFQEDVDQGHFLPVHGQAHLLLLSM
ncbi:unnamed protein product [Prunus brigantina]